MTRFNDGKIDRRIIHTKHYIPSSKSENGPKFNFYINMKKKTKKVNSCCIDSKVTRNEYRLWAKFGEKHTLNTEIDIFFGS